MNADLMDQIVRLLGPEVQEFAEDLDGLEAHVQGLMRQASRGLLQHAVANRRNGYVGSRRSCPCGGFEQFKGYRSKTVLTLFGPVKVARGYYRCGACGGSSIPYDRASGLGEGVLSNRLASAVSLLAVDISFQKACEKIERLLGVRVDDNTAWAGFEQAGAVALSSQQQAIERFQRSGQLPERAPGEGGPQRLYLSSDGGMAPIRPSPEQGSGESINWREVKCAAAWWQDGDGPPQQRYTARIEPAESFGWKWWLLAAECGVRRAEQVVVLGDGAAWIWNLAERFFSRAVQILDWYHAAEHLFECGQQLHGQATAAARRWSEQMEAILWEGGGTALLQRLSRQQRRRRQPSEALDELIGYVESNQSRMAYPSYRAQGLQIGSGPVESTCKQLVTARLKQSGMRWTVDGAEQTLALRCCWLNGQWDQFWQSKPLAA